MKNVYSMFAVIFLSLAFLYSDSNAQDEKCLSFATGTDVVSSYNWRAIDYGNSPAVQPYMSLLYSGFEMTAWGSYALVAQETVDGERVPFTEIDLIFKYSINTTIGTFSPEVVDFFYPYEKGRYSDYKGDGQGQHWINIALKYKGTDQFPIQLTLDYAAHNDKDTPIYFEAGYPFTVGETDLNVFAGFAKGKDKTDLYGIGDDKVGFINAGITVTKNLTISKELSIPISTSFVMNPNASRAYFVFKMSF